MSQRKTLYLIDGSSYIFRAFYGIRQALSNSRGLPTNAIYGFVNMLNKVVREEKPDYLAVVFDSKEKTFRHEMAPGYKANRETPPEDLQAQFPYFEPLVEAYNIASLRVPGFEADDIIGTLAKMGEKEGLDVVIVSGDKDMMQLVGPRVHMLDTMKDKRFADAEVVEKFGVAPGKVIEGMGLMGDTSDNVPGVHGVGPKTASELIQRYGSIEAVYDHIDEITKKKLKENLERDRDQAFLSRKLVTIHTDMKLDRELEDLECREPDREALTRLFTELEFSSLLKDLRSGGRDPVAGGGKPQAGESRYHTVLTRDALDALIDGLKRAGRFAVDLETTSLHPVQAQPVGISFSFKDHEAYYIPVGHHYLGAPVQLDPEEVFKKLKPLLENPGLGKVGQNIKYDLIVLHNEGIRLQGIVFDTMLASYVLNPTTRGHNMDDLALEYLGHKTIHYKDVVGTGAKQIGFSEVDIERATEYAAEDADVTWRLFGALAPRLDPENMKLLEEIELPLLEVLGQMEMDGVLLNREHLAGLSRKIDKELKDYENRIYQLAGEVFNINSPKQLSVILFEKLKLPALKKTKSGFSTDVSVLEDLADRHPLPKLMLDYRQVAKLKSTYVDSLPGEIYGKTGRVHTSFNQSVAATGRLSSSDPNLQNIPVRTEMGREIRMAFVAAPGCRLLSADYSQIELRLLAHLSGDEALSRAFERGEDVHSRTAAEIFGKSLDEVDSESRRMAKAVNFGIVYGLSPFGLSRQLKITPREARDFIDRYFRLYKKVKQFMEDTVESARKRGYTLTLMNRRRYLPDITSTNRQVREAAERVAINSPVQGSAADLIKLAMIRLHRKLPEMKLKSRMILQVHDELVFECPEGEHSKIQALVKQEMEGVYPLDVPLVVDIGWGHNWSEVH